MQTTPFTGLSSMPPSTGALSDEPRSKPDVSEFYLKAGETLIHYSVSCEPMTQACRVAAEVKAYFESQTLTPAERRAFRSAQFVENSLDIGGAFDLCIDTLVRQLNEVATRGAKEQAKNCGSLLVAMARAYTSGSLVVPKLPSARVEAQPYLDAAGRD